MYDVLTDDCSDCPMCRAQMRADKEGRTLTLDEFIAATREAEQRGAVLGLMDDMPVFPRSFSPDGFAMGPSIGQVSTWPFPFMDEPFAYECKKMAGSPKAQEADTMPFINRPPAEA